MRTYLKRIIGSKSEELRSLAYVTRTAILWSFWIALLGIWIATLFALSEEGLNRQWIDAVLIITSLVVLFFAEGLELAVADLLDKHPDQLSDPRQRKLLAEIQQNGDFFFSTRQVFVVIIITFMSLATNYSWISCPVVGKICRLQYALLVQSHIYFSDCVVVLPGCPKTLGGVEFRIVLEAQCISLAVGKGNPLVGLPYASDQIVWLFKKFTPYCKKRHLRPSPAAHYNTTSQIHGVSLDRVHVEGDSRKRQFSEGSSHFRNPVLAWHAVKSFRALLLQY